MAAVSPVMDIAELVDAILSELEDPRDMINMACVATRFKDMALRKAWTSPVFDGSPLTTMAGLFPEAVSRQLRESEDSSYRVSPDDYDRFDYYARFIRHLSLWQHKREAYIAKILSASRPNVWMFPCLEDLHLGAAGEDIETVPTYLTPTLRTVRLNHWELDKALTIAPTDLVRSALLWVFQLPKLELLDLLDTRFPAYEDDPELVGSITEMARQLRSFRSYDFTTLEEVFRAMSKGPRVEEVFLDLTHPDDGHLPLPEIITLLRDEFPALLRLGLLCTSPDAARLLKEIDRPLNELDLRIDTPVRAQDLQEITCCAYTKTASLTSFRCTSSSSLECGSDPPMRINECLESLRSSSNLRDLFISISFDGEQSLQDKEIVEYFRAWPHLRSFIIETDPEDESVPAADEVISYGLTLQCLVAAAQHCPNLVEISLPYVDTSVIPVVERPILTSTAPVALHFGRAHVHDRQGLGNFVASLWPKADISLEGCCHYPRVEYKAVEPPPSFDREDARNGTSMEGSVEAAAEGGERAD